MMIGILINANAHNAFSHLCAFPPLWEQNFFMNLVSSALVRLKQLKGVKGEKHSFF